MLWHSSVSTKKRPSPHLTGGFSLIELMISITIMVIVISIVSTSQGAFNGAVLLRGQAYEAALKIREVQLIAVGAVGDSSDAGTPGQFRAIYGVHFDTDSSKNGRYIIFKDANANGFYDGAGEKYGQQGFLDNRFEIREIRKIDGGSTESVDALSVVFVRPNFDARFFDSVGEIEPSSVEIDIARRESTEVGPGDIRTLEITPTGQISVKSIP
jgi:prepilin-type N-terminal cleavage/methylation domain-containing protein